MPRHSRAIAVRALCSKPYDHIVHGRVKLLLTRVPNCDVLCVRLLSMLEAAARMYGKRSRDADRVVYLVDLHIFGRIMINQSMFGTYIRLLLSSSNPTIR